MSFNSVVDVIRMYGDDVIRSIALLERLVDVLIDTFELDGDDLAKLKQAVAAADGAEQYSRAASQRLRERLEHHIAALESS